MPQHDQPYGEIDLDHLAQSAFSGVNAQHRETMAALKRVLSNQRTILQNQETIMAKIDDEAAAVAANTAIVKKMSDAITAMADGHSTISDEIEALKNANPAVDFTALDAALADQTAAVTSASALVPTP